MAIETYDRGCKFSLLKPYDVFAKEDEFMEICEWKNGEGFDVTINDKTFSLTLGQFECLQALVAYKE